MSMFKITPPDGILKDHLSGRSPKARNFELLRLATTALLIEKGRIPVDLFVVKNSPNDALDNNKATSNINEKSKKPEQKETVDFGVDITSL